MHAAAQPSVDWPAYARQVIESAVRGVAPEYQPSPVSGPHGGVFVTLHKFKRLRGCMGTLDPSLSVADAVRRAAASSALHDPRFSPVAVAELPDLVVEVSILSAPEPMGTIDELELGRHGVIVRQGMRQGLFLPQVAVEHHLDKETLLSRCCREKAGLSPDAWRDPDTEVLLFTAQVFSEEERGSL
ncbi:MAG: AmmeMemoRadiSam system protein A [Phycisphaerae bacterium]|jgi:AmmeMemoRadiSam system protein A